MKVKLRHAPPVEKRHGATAGRIFEAEPAEEDNKRGYNGAVWVVGDAGEPLKLLRHEFDIVEEDGTDG